VGERRTATTLRQEPRHTESILSSSLSSQNFRPLPGLQRPRHGVRNGLQRGRMTEGALPVAYAWDM
jgi:hypothetical protein